MNERYLKELVRGAPILVNYFKLLLKFKANKKRRETIMEKMHPQSSIVWGILKRPGTLGDHEGPFQSRPIFPHPLHSPPPPLPHPPIPTPTFLPLSSTAHGRGWQTELREKRTSDPPQAQLCRRLRYSCSPLYLYNT